MGNRRRDNSDTAWSSAHRHTVRCPISLTGIGVHTGHEARVTVRPLHEPQGLILNQAPISEWIPTRAQWSTLISHHRSMFKLSTPEHLCAALYGAGVDDAFIEVAPLDSQTETIELPILDGSARPYFELIEPVETGSKQGIRYLRNLSSLPTQTLRLDQCYARLSPEPLEGALGDLTLTLTLTLIELYPELAHLTAESSRVQRVTLNSQSDLRDTIIPARTFGLAAHEERLRELGLIKGVSEINTVILDHNGKSRTPLRSPNELAAHKLLDALGDLTLSGHRWRGHIELRRGSHALNHMILKALRDM